MFNNDFDSRKIGQRDIVMAEFSPTSNLNGTYLVVCNTYSVAYGIRLSTVGYSLAINKDYLGVNINMEGATVKMFADIFSGMKFVKHSFIKSYMGKLDVDSYSKICAASYLYMMGRYTLIDKKILIENRDINLDQFKATDPRMPYAEEHHAINQPIHSHSVVSNDKTDKEPYTPYVENHPVSQSSIRSIIPEDVFEAINKVVDNQVHQNDEISPVPFEKKYALYFNATTDSDRLNAMFHLLGNSEQKIPLLGAYNILIRKKESYEIKSTDIFVDKATFIILSYGDESDCIDKLGQQTVSMYRQMAHSLLTGNKRGYMFGVIEEITQDILDSYSDPVAVKTLVEIANKRNLTKSIVSEAIVDKTDTSVKSNDSLDESSDDSYIAVNANIMRMKAKNKRQMLDAKYFDAYMNMSASKVASAACGEWNPDDTNSLDEYIKYRIGAAQILSGRWVNNLFSGKQDDPMLVSILANSTEWISEKCMCDKATANSILATALMYHFDSAYISKAREQFSIKELIDNHVSPFYELSQMGILHKYVKSLANDIGITETDLDELFDNGKKRINIKRGATLSFDK